ALDAEFGVDSQSAAPAPGAGRVGRVFVADQDMRVLDLKHLIVLRQQAAAAIDKTDMVVAVCLERRAGPAFEREEENVYIGPAAARIRTGEGETEQPVPAGGDHLRDCLGESSEDGIRGWPGQRIAEG